MKKKLSTITVPEGRRNLVPVKVAELAESIKIIGLVNPIAVDKNDTLIAGAHRLEAYKMLEFDEIECTVLDGDDLHNELAEIDENLVRRDLDAISIGEMTIRRDEILEELGLRANQSNKGKSTGAESAPVKTTADIAKESGVSERVLQENKQLARDLVQEAKDVCREKEIPKSAALKLARLEPTQQQEVIEQIKQGKSINAALPKRAPKQSRSKPPAEEPEPENITDPTVEHTEDAADILPVQEGPPSKAPTTLSNLKDRLVGELTNALDLPVDSQQRSDALRDFHKTVFADCFVDNKVRRDFLQNMLTEAAEYGVRAH